ncbi:MAG TPA: response regulator [Candidatus Deferrimicrobium sp.]|nr:response regulator [Candidatus Deferrimicrobium sp.]
MNSSSVKPIRILVVDDENIVLSLVRDALEDNDYLVETALRATDALRLMETEEFDLIITDIRMPDINGIDLVKRARAVRPEMSVIFMTGYANLNSAKDAIKQGACDYIMKPFELDEIRRAVQAAAQKIRKEAAARLPDQPLQRLSDLNQMLLTVGDRSTLCTVALRFAMMHCAADCGAILFWDRTQSKFTRITIAKESASEESLPVDPLRECVRRTEGKQFSEPLFVTQLEEHPLYRAHPDPSLAPLLLPRWPMGSIQMIVVPVRKSETLLGLLMIGFPDSMAGLKGTDLKLLSISARQLALSLENLELLEETQSAYARLKELQDETIQLEKMATRGELSAEIGHELNNFLGVVTGNLSLLDYQLSKGSFDDLGKYVRVMTDTIDKIKKFTSNLMDLAPISSKKETLYFDRLLAEVVDYLKPQRRFQGVTIKLDEPGQAIPFEADTVHIQQLLYNLFNNAADATANCPRREITATCSIDPDSRSFRFVITDSGSGIEPDLVQKLFNEKFTTKRGGHGFGLVVCKRIVDNHGGTIRATSAPGTGTTIQMDFPVGSPSPLSVTTEVV